MILSDFEEVSACASVLATTNSTPSRPETIMLLTALPPAPPTPATIICGFSSRSSGALRLIVIVWPLDVGALFFTLGFDLFWLQQNEIFRRVYSPHAR